MNRDARSRLALTVLALSAFALAWLATGVRAFSALAYVVVAVPALGALLAYAALGGFSPSNDEVTRHYRSRSAETTWQNTAPWIVLAALALILESVGLALGGRSPSVPTLSTTVDHLLVSHLGRWLLFVAWLAVGAGPLRRLGLVRRGPR